MVTPIVKVSVDLGATPTTVQFTRSGLPKHTYAPSVKKLDKLFRAVEKNINSYDPRVQPLVKFYRWGWVAEW